MFWCSGSSPVSLVVLKLAVEGVLLLDVLLSMKLFDRQVIDEGKG